MSTLVSLDMDLKYMSSKPFYLLIHRKLEALNITLYIIVT